MVVLIFEKSTRSRAAPFSEVGMLKVPLFKSDAGRHLSAGSKCKSPMVWTHLGLAIYAQGRRTAKQIGECQIHCDQVRALFPVVLILANAVPLVKRRCQKGTTGGLAACQRSHRRQPGRRQDRLPYFTSTVAPASVNFFLMVSASSLFTPSFMGLGAPSTRSLASFKPKLVTSRTALITLILLAPAAFNITVNSVFSSAGAAAAAPPPAGAAATAAAAAETPSFSSSILTS